MSIMEDGPPIIADRKPVAEDGPTVEARHLELARNALERAVLAPAPVDAVKYLAGRIAAEGAEQYRLGYLETEPPALTAEQAAAIRNVMRVLDVAARFQRCSPPFGGTGAGAGTATFWYDSGNREFSSVTVEGVSESIRRLFPSAFAAPAATPERAPEPVLGDERETPETGLGSKRLGAALDKMDEALAEYWAVMGKPRPPFPAPPDAPRFRTEQFWAPTLRRLHDGRPYVWRQDPRQPTLDIRNALIFDSQPACDRWVREHGTDDYATVPLELRISVDGKESV